MMAAKDFTISFTVAQAHKALAGLCLTTLREHRARCPKCLPLSPCTRAEALAEVAAEQAARAMPRGPAREPMRPGRTVALRAWLDRLTPDEERGLQYLIAHVDRNGRTEILLPDPDGDARDFLTERERAALQSFYAREATPR